jgi:hypothetical protein
MAASLRQHVLPAEPGGSLMGDPGDLVPYYPRPWESSRGVV